MDMDLKDSSHLQCENCDEECLNDIVKQENEEVDMEEEFHTKSNESVSQDNKCIEDVCFKTEPLIEDSGKPSCNEEFKILIKQQPSYDESEADTLCSFDPSCKVKNEF